MAAGWRTRVGPACACARALERGLSGAIAMWLQTTTASERHALLATYAGYGLDGFDFMVYSFVIPSLLTLWGMSNAQAGYIASGALITSAVGGWAAGVLADRYGRSRILQLTVVWF